MGAAARDKLQTVAVCETIPIGVLGEAQRR
jgi:hypothetical protein